MKDYYGVLGLSDTATPEEIKRAFRSKARESHPDANPGDPAAEARFREVAEAYEVLSDPQRKAAYDRGETFGAGDLFSSVGGLDDLLQQFFGGFGGFGGRQSSGPRRGKDVSLAVEITLEEAAFGTERDLEYMALEECSRCMGIGAATADAVKSCATCAGRGQVQVQRNTILGAVMTVSECSTCRGRGRIITDRCIECHGEGRVHGKKQVSVEIPEGVADGTRLRLTGRGGAGEVAGANGDLYVQIKVAPHKRFVRVGDDLRYRMTIGLAEAALGTEHTVELLDGEMMPIDIPPGTQPATVYRVAKQGMPRLRRRGRGDLLIDIDVEVPTKLSREEEDALRAYAEIRGEAPSGKRRKKKRKR